MEHTSRAIDNFTPVSGHGHGHGHVYGRRFRDRPYYNTGDRVRFWGRTGAFWGGLAGILFSSAFLIIPVVGHVIVLGPLVTSLIGGLEGAAVGGGTSAIFAALVGLGIPKASAVHYQYELN